jgi:hypothetical protein
MNILTEHDRKIPLQKRLESCRPTAYMQQKSLESGIIFDMLSR